MRLQAITTQHTSRVSRAGVQINDLSCDCVPGKEQERQADTLHQHNAKKQNGAFKKLAEIRDANKLDACF